MKPSVVLLPGFGGSADQPILQRLISSLSPWGEGRGEGNPTPTPTPTPTLRALEPPRQKLTPDLTEYTDWLEAETSTIPDLLIVGRSFGGRLAIRLAQRRRLRGIVLLGFPVRPPRKPRPLDEAALQALKCPTLIIQGTKDALGPLKVLRPLVAKNAHLELHELPGAGHSFGRHERAAIEVAAGWIRAR